MYNKSALLLLVLLIAASLTRAQVSYLPLGQQEYPLLDRLETRSGRLSDTLFLTAKPVSRQSEVEFLMDLRRNARNLELGTVDRSNISHAVSCSGEWASDGEGAIDSKHPWFNTFYKKQPDFVYANTKGFFLSLNPVLGATGMYESFNAGTSKAYNYTAGLALRSTIGNRVGLYVNVTGNGEQPVSYVNDWIKKFNAVPGARDYSYTAPNQYTYLQAAGALDVALIKGHLNATLGYDKNFIGDGMRTLFLSDFSAPAPFVKLTTHIWKIKYQNLYLELVPQFSPGSPAQHTHKYATMHHLSVNVTRWLNFGIFEAVVFGRPNHFEFGYLNPIILYRQTERSLGSPDKVNLGFNLKAIAAHHLQFYGQFLLNEFTAREFFGNRGYWANKWGLQLGAKYFDAFTVKNLDLQAELNMVRPYTFTHYDTTSNFTHYNQPLAHPLGAGFREYILAARYQPLKDLFINAKFMYYQQGLDTGSSNFGSNILLDYDTRSMNYGVSMINGIESHTSIIDVNLSYRVAENLFVDLGATRRSAYNSLTALSNTSSYFYAGIRLNLARRDYNFY